MGTAQTDLINEITPKQDFICWHWWFQFLSICWARQINTVSREDPVGIVNKQD
jgi:hypothetical protein